MISRSASLYAHLAYSRSSKMISIGSALESISGRCCSNPNNSLFAIENVLYVSAATVSRMVGAGSSFFNSLPGSRYRRFCFVLARRLRLRLRSKKMGQPVAQVSPLVTSLFCYHLLQVGRHTAIYDIFIVARERPAAPAPSKY